MAGPDVYARGCVWNRAARRSSWERRADAKPWQDAYFRIDRHAGWTTVVRLSRWGSRRSTGRKRPSASHLSQGGCSPPGVRRTWIRREPCAASGDWHSSEDGLACESDRERTVKDEVGPWAGRVVVAEARVVGGRVEREVGEARPRVRTQVCRCSPASDVLLKEGREWQDFAVAAPTASRATSPGRGIYG